MAPSIVASNVGKMFRRYHADRPTTIQEAVAKGLRRRRTVERFWGLQDVSFSVGAGKTVGIVGSNGSGKSTLLRLIGGVGRPDTGRIDVHGRIGALLDLGAGFHPDLTGRENAVLAGILNGLTRRQVLERLESIVAFAEIEKALDNPIRTYSSGMQMRLAFSVAVHTEPEILLIDEVLSVGDMAFQRKCLERIGAFKAAGCTILLVSHVGRTVEDLCDEAIWLNEGRLMEQGVTGDVIGRYAEHVAANDAARQEGSASDEGQSYPVVSPSPITIRTERGNEVVVDDRRFSSPEVEIGAVRVLDGDGQPFTELPSGQPVQIEMDYVANVPTVAPIFCLRIDRDNGQKLYNFSALGPPMNLMAIHGPGRVSLRIERLDLNTGQYFVSVACYAQDWAYAYDNRESACSFAVKGRGLKDALLNAPHRWDIREDTPGTAAG